MTMRTIVYALIGSMLSLPALAGPFVPGTLAEPFGALSSTDPSIVGWASGVADFSPGPAGITSFQIAANALGTAEGTSEAIANLGRGGSITLTFDGPIIDGPGADFAVFENGFNVSGGIFAELAWVEVSSNGTDFLRMPNFSWTSSPVPEFGAIDPTNIFGLAGKYPAGQGTQFDLSVFASAGVIDLDNVLYLRIVDIIGDGSARDNSPALQFVACETGNCPIYDPFKPALQGANGFDLDAVAVLNQGAITAVPLPAAVYLFAAALSILNRRPFSGATRRQFR